MRAILAGIAIMVIGIGAVSYMQLGVPEPARTAAILEPGETVTLESVLDGLDTGFVRVTLDAPRDSVRVDVLSPTGSELYSSVLSTQQSVDYFVIDQDGAYTVRATLESAQSSLISVEIGQTASTATMYPAIVLIAGVIITIASLCIRFARYITAQPDENTL